MVSDQLNHASIIDAVRVAGVKNKFAYAHSDMGDLEAKLKQAAELQKTPKKNGEQPLILVVTDGVFSMDGDLAPLDKIVDLCKKYDALSMVDDAHGEGVLGEGGRGVVHHFGLEGEVDIEIGSLSKAFSVMGGFIAAKQPLVDHYLMNARQRLMSIALTIPDTAALIEAVKMLGESTIRVDKLWDNVKDSRRASRSRANDIDRDADHPGDARRRGLRARVLGELFEEGVFAGADRLPDGEGERRASARERESFSKADCEAGLAAFKKGSRAA